MSGPKLQTRSSSFHRASQRKVQHEATEYVNRHLAIAQVNHRERCSQDLEKTEELCSLVKASMEYDNASTLTAITSPRAVDLELLALFEGKTENGERSTECIESEWKRLSIQLGSAGLQVGSGSGSIAAVLRAAQSSTATGVPPLAVAIDWLADRGPDYRCAHKL